MSIQQFQDELNSKFSGADLDFPEFCLVDHNTPLACVIDCEKRLNMTFPRAFIEITTRYNFGRLRIGHFAFGDHGEYYEQLTDWNVDQPGQQNPWWEWSNNERPKEYVYIGLADMFAVIMKWRTGELYAFMGGDLWSDSKVMIAKGFSDFFVAVGTIGVRRKIGEGNLDLAKEVAEAVGGEEGLDFWQEMTY